jgi:uncharacterized protein (DUF433 family)
MKAHHPGSIADGCGAEFFEFCGINLTMKSISIEHVEKTPGICGGRTCIAGHRIRVADVVAWHEKRGYCPEEIVEMFPGLTLADIHAALTYYFDYPQEIEADLRTSAEWTQWLKANVPSKIPASLREKQGD